MKKIVTIIVCLLCCDFIAAQTYTLQQLKDSALRNNIAVRTARLDIDAAKLQRKEALTNYFPNVSGTGLWFNSNKGMAKTEMNLSEQIAPEMGAALAQSLPAEALAALGSPISITMMKKGLIGSLTAIQPLFAGGQIINGNRLAKVGEDVSRLQLQLSENEVEKQTEQYYWQLVSMQQKMKTIDAVETLLADIYKDVEVAVRAGVAMRNDLLQVQLRQNDIESQKVKLQNGISIVKMLVSQYCGLRDSSFNIGHLPLTIDHSDGAANVQSSISNVQSSTFNVALSGESAHARHSSNEFGSALAQSQTSIFNVQCSMFNVQRPTFNVQCLPEYQLLQKQVEAAKLQRKMEVGKNLPSLGIGAGYNYHNLLDNDHAFGMVFATVSVPISDWWGGSHAIKRRKIQEQKAIAQLEDNSQLLKIRMQKAWNDVQESYQQLQIAQRSIEQAEENLRLNRNYYRAGTCRMSDLLEAQLLYQQACDKQTDAYADYQNKLLEYRQSTGQ